MQEYVSVTRFFEESDYDELYFDQVEMSSLLRIFKLLK